MSFLKTMKTEETNGMSSVMKSVLTQAKNGLSCWFIGHWSSLKPRVIFSDIESMYAFRLLNRVNIWFVPDSFLIRQIVGNTNKACRFMICRVMATGVTSDLTDCDQTYFSLFREY